MKDVGNLHLWHFIQ